MVKLAGRVTHSVKAPALQAQSPRTPRGQIQVVGHHNRGEPVGYVQSF